MNEIKIYQHWKDKVRIGIFGDTHAASDEGIHKPGSLDAQGNVVFSKVGESIYRRLMKSLDGEPKIDILYVMGDTAEGIQNTILGYSVKTNNTNTAVSWAVEIFSDIIKKLEPKYLMFINGTPTHTGYAASLDKQVFDQLVLRFPKLECYFGDSLDIKVGSLWHNVAHFYPTSRNSMGPSHSILQEMFEDAGIKRGHIYSLICRAHIHKHVWIDYRGIKVATGFSLQDTTSFWQRRGHLGTPDIGYFVIEQEGNSLQEKPVYI